MFVRLAFAVSVCSLVIPGVTGCGRPGGPELVEVNGVITLDGKPAPKLVIRFIPDGEKGSPSYGVTNQSGEYTLMYSADRVGAMPGKHRVEIEAVPPEIGENGEPVSGQIITEIPSRYSEPGALTAEVVDNGNPIDFELKSE